MIQDPLALLCIFCILVFFSLWLEKRWHVFAKVGSTLLVIIFASFCSNLGFISTSSTLYDAVFRYTVPLAVVFLLINLNLGHIRIAGKQTLLAFALGCVGTIVGAIVGYFLVSGNIGQETWKLAGQLTGTYTGGSMNAVAVGKGLHMSPHIFSASIASDNVTTALWIVATILIPVYLSRLFPTQKGQKKPVHQGNLDTSGHNLRLAPFDLVEAGKLFSIAMGIFVISEIISRYISSIPSILWVTTFAIIAGQIKMLRPKVNSFDLGVFVLLFFFATLGAMSNIVKIIKVGPVIFIFTLVVVGIHGVIIFVFGRILRFDLNVLCVASQACIGGPSTAMALASSKKWDYLILPGIMTGILGYGIGNYLGFGIAYLFSSV